MFDASTFNKEAPVAQRTIIQNIDDIDGTLGSEEDPVESVEFTYEGTTYRIDLTTDNHAKLDDALAPFITSAHRIGGSSPRRNRGAAAQSSNKDALDRASSKAVRAWARKAGVRVSERGRVPVSLVEGWREAGSPMDVE